MHEPQTSSKQPQSQAPGQLSCFDRFGLSRDALQHADDVHVLFVGNLDAVPNTMAAPVRPGEERGRLLNCERSNRWQLQTHWYASRYYVNRWYANGVRSCVHLNPFSWILWEQRLAGQPRVLSTLLR